MKRNFEMEMDSLTAVGDERHMRVLHYAGEMKCRFAIGRLEFYQMCQDFLDEHGDCDFNIAQIAGLVRYRCVTTMEDVVR